MNEQNSTVMSMVERYYEDYGIRARELKKEGKTVISYLCSLVPMEIITAAGLVPFSDFLSLLPGSNGDYYGSGIGTFQDKG
jgi:benzoyl-CoA reductase/2-hydroxyglutaryl-CoA dehydratase subunit BcrC/BadD/HgdB